VAAPETRQATLNEISGRLVSTETKTRALALCPQLFRADGEFTPVERAVFVEIKQAFGWPS
jgi:tellurite resistance protein